MVLLLSALLGLMDDVDDVADFAFGESLVLEDEADHLLEGVVEEGALDGFEVDFGIFLRADGGGVVESVAFFTEAYEPLSDKYFQECSQCGVGGLGVFVFVEDVSRVAALVW